MQPASWSIREREEYAARELANEYARLITDAEPLFVGTDSTTAPKVCTWRYWPGHEEEECRYKHMVRVPREELEALEELSESAAAPAAEGSASGSWSEAEAFPSSISPKRLLQASRESFPIP